MKHPFAEAVEVGARRYGASLTSCGKNADTAGVSTAFPPQFEPLPGKRSKRIFLLLAPLAWVVVLTGAAIVVNRTDLIFWGFLIAFASFVLGVAVLVPLRIRRVRQERKPATRSR